MKTALTLLLILISTHSFSQDPHEISETDTTLDYKTRFYKNGVLDLNGYLIYKSDSISYFSNDSIPYQDTLGTDDLKDGKWIQNYLLKKKSYYSLTEYEGTFLVGKRYDFRKDGTLYSTFKRYPAIKDSTFNGSQIIYYDKKGNYITRIEYILFNQDETNLFFWYTIYYSSEGKLSYFSYENEKAGMNHSISYNKKGEMIREHIRNSTEWTTKKWNSRRTKLKLTEQKKDATIISTYRNEKLVRKKTKNH